MRWGEAGEQSLDHLLTRAMQVRLGSTNYQLLKEQPDHLLTRVIQEKVVRESSEARHPPIQAAVI